MYICITYIHRESKVAFVLKHNLYEISFSPFGSKERERERGKRRENTRDHVLAREREREVDVMSKQRLVRDSYT